MKKKRLRYKNWLTYNLNKNKKVNLRLIGLNMSFLKGHNLLKQIFNLKLKRFRKLKRHLKNKRKKKMNSNKNLNKLKMKKNKMKFFYNKRISSQKRKLKATSKKLMIYKLRKIRNIKLKLIN